MRPDERAVFGTCDSARHRAGGERRRDRRRGLGGRLGGSEILVSTKMLRVELLSVKIDLESEFEKGVLDCAVCGTRDSIEDVFCRDDVQTWARISSPQRSGVNADDSSRSWTGNARP